VNWEKSGNGFGQRGDEDNEWGRFSDAHLTLEEGDNRSNFIMPQLGHCPHHLHLWKLADEMGILSNVLNVMSPQVSAKCDNVAVDAQEVQRPNIRRREEEKKKQAKHQKIDEAFCVGVFSSLASISMSQVSERLMREEENVRTFRFQLIKTTSVPEATLLNHLIDAHAEKIEQLEADLAKMKEHVANLMSVFTDL